MKDKVYLNLPGFIDVITMRGKLNVHIEHKPSYLLWKLCNAIRANNKIIKHEQQN